MKNIIYFTMILLTFAVVGCEKEETPEPQQQTLEQLYPDWKNLTWEKTYRNSDDVEVPFPKCNSIKIVGNVVRISTQTQYDSMPIPNKYDQIIITGDIIRFYYSHSGYTAAFSFRKSGEYMILNEHKNYIYRYVMKIN